MSAGGVVGQRGARCAALPLLPQRWQAFPALGTSSHRKLPLLAPHLPACVVLVQAVAIQALEAPPRVSGGAEQAAGVIAAQAGSQPARALQARGAARWPVMHSQFRARS